MEYVVSCLDQADKALMLAMNFDGGVVLDHVFYTFSLPFIWIPVELMFVYVLLRRGVPFSTIALLVLGLATAIGLSDFVASGLLKPYFMRLRPSHCLAINGLLHYVGTYRGGQYGFVSSHAATAFSIFTFVSLIVRRKKITYPLLILAICVCYSRIYLGVHYPGDILGGALMGSTIGYGVYFVTSHYRKIMVVTSHVAFAQRDGVYFSSVVYLCLALPVLYSITIVEII